MRFVEEPQGARNGRGLCSLDPRVEITLYISEAGLVEFLVVRQRGLIDVEHYGEFFVGPLVGKSPVQKSDGAVRLQIEIVRVAAAGAGTVVILTQLLPEDIDVGDAFGPSVFASSACA